MKQEKLILSFVAILIGLAVAGAAFFLYQNTTKKSQPEIVRKISPTPLPVSSFYLSITDPKDQSVASSKTIKISGKTSPTATVIVFTSGDQQVIQPTKLGDFNTTIQITEGLNLIKITAIEKDGETQTVERMVGYSTEDF